MKRLTCLSSLLLLSFFVFAKKIVVRNADEINHLKNLQPGDTVVLQNGTWNDAIIKLTASGTAEHPIVFCAETPGKMIITGTSQLRLGGDYLVIDGWYFTDGHTPGSAVIDFRVNDKQLANHCRVTNCVIEDFNQPKRLNEDYWISFSGQHNRLDHCSFFEKKNLGVLLAVILDDDRSRTNFHEIDHNFFGRRAPLGSNAGEIIRVGVSQHCQFNSNTQIHDNYFYQCDGETEIVSIKSCSNVVSNNVFEKCQGDVVLRHGNYNTVVNNIFLGRGKEGTGGVRVINRGQWVENNLFYQCRGVSFRSPLSLMNGIPNSPANRYVQVTDAVIANNTFYGCSPISFCEGSDAERTLPPANVLFANNIFYNDKDSVIYHVFDRIDSVRFVSNKVSKNIPQDLVRGFERSSISTEKSAVLPIPVSGAGNNKSWIDSLQKIKGNRPFAFSSKPGFSGVALVQSLYSQTKNSGAGWYRNLPPERISKGYVVDCATAEEVYKALDDEENRRPAIRLTGTRYIFDRPLVIDKSVNFEGGHTEEINFVTESSMDALFVLKGKSVLSLFNMKVSGKGLHAENFIATDTAGSSEHFNLSINNCGFANFEDCVHFFYAHAATIADVIAINSSRFTGLNDGLLLEDEKENKGYYNVEKMVIINSVFENGKGRLLSLYRGGNDESTMGPDFVFGHNYVSNYNTTDGQPLIYLTGVQKTNIRSSNFQNSNASGTLILYKDTVRAVHQLANNIISHSGAIQKDQFVTESNNQIK